MENTDRLVTTVLVIAECADLIDRQLGPAAEAECFRAVARGDIETERLTAADLDRIAELIDTYADLPLGGTDASVITIAERFDQARIATLDRRHFTIVRPKHRQASFELVP